MVCDQCYSKHRRCSRQRPSCSRCIKLGIDCTWNRPILKKSRGYHDKIIFTLDTGTSRSVQSLKKESNTNIVVFDEKSKEILYSRFKANTLNREHKQGIIRTENIVRNWDLYKKQEGDNTSWIDTPWKSKVSFRLTFSMFTKISGITKYMSSGEKQSLIKLFLSASPPAINRSLQVKLKNEDKDILMNFGFQRFFSCMNCSIPLFTLQGYLSRKRSRLLYLAICITGLKMLPFNSPKDNLIEFLEKEFKSLFSFYNLPLTLDTAQTLLVYCHGFMFQADSKIQTLLRIVGTILRSFGFNRSFPKSSSLDFFLEVELARSVINRLDGIFFYSGRCFINDGYSNQILLRAEHQFSENCFKIALGSYSKSISCSLSKRDITIPLNFFTETIQLLACHGLNQSVFIIKKASYIISNSDLSYEKMMLVIKSFEDQVQNVIFKFLNEISKFYNIFLNYLCRSKQLRSYRDMTEFTLAAMRIWSLTLVSGFLHLVFLKDLLPFPSLKLSDQVFNDYYCYTLSIIKYADNFIELLDRINLQHFFVANAPYILMVLARTLLKIIQSYSYAKKWQIPPIEVYTNEFLKVYNKLKQMQKFHLYARPTTVSLRVLDFMLISNSLKHLIPI